VLSVPPCMGVLLQWTPPLLLLLFSSPLRPSHPVFPPPSLRSLQLRSLAAALRRQDDVKGVLEALGRLEPLIRCRPDELGPSAAELSRALLYCRVPEWAQVEDPG
jgi:hypothetical protein